MRKQTILMFILLTIRVPSHPPAGPPIRPPSYRYRIGVLPHMRDSDRRRSQVLGQQRLRPAGHWGQQPVLFSCKCVWWYDFLLTPILWYVLWVTLVVDGWTDNVNIQMGARSLSQFTYIYMHWQAFLYRHTHTWKAYDTQKWFKFIFSSPDSVHVGIGATLNQKPIIWSDVFPLWD